MEIIKEFRNDLLKRGELKIVAKAEKNPGFAEATKIIANHFKVKEDVVAIKEIKSKFGRDTFLIDAFVYDSFQDLQRIEPKKKQKKSANPTPVQAQPAKAPEAKK